MEKYKENINCENAIVEVDQTNNRIREEFIKEFPHVFDHEDQYDLNRNEVINWWLSKIDELLKSQRDSLVEKIKDYKPHIGEDGLLRRKGLLDYLSPIKENKK